MKLLVGLGNPGPQYARNRHNIGFLALDYLLQRHRVSQEKSEFKALTAKFELGDKTVLVCKPQTFMNLSGESVRPLVDYYKIALNDLLVVHDELDLPFLAIRYQSDRGAGGHNGIKSLHQNLGSQAYDRLKLGIGKPVAEGPSPRDWVLQDFSKTELQDLQKYFAVVADSLELYVEKGHQLAATKFNRLPKS